MGIIFAKFRKEKTTAVILERLELRIQQLEDYSQNTQQRNKRYLFNFLALSISLYVLGIAYYLFFNYPRRWSERLKCFAPLMLIPCFIYGMRYILTWYFQRMLNRCYDQLAELHEEKKRILDTAMEKETYKVALSLLERYGDRKPYRPALNASTPRSPARSTSPRRSLGAQNLSAVPPTNGTPTRAVVSTPQRLPAQSPTQAVTPRRIVSPSQPYESVYRSAVNPNRSLLVTSPNQQQQQSLELRHRRPFPVLDNRNRSAIDRLMDIIVGDGPADRYAMICRECHAHNGMAPKEEFDYATYRCAFCDALNPARKQRPKAPRLSAQHAITASPMPGIHVMSPSTATDSENNADSTDDGDGDDDDVADVAEANTMAMPKTNTTETGATSAAAASNGDIEQEFLHMKITEYEYEDSPQTPSFYVDASDDAAQ